ncbi:MAG: porin family protein [Hyphomicrobium sp.]|nr:porin family protein [Hyphomicrobium sp.]
MKVQIAFVSLAALAAVTASPALAADWNGGAGSIKDMSGSSAIPVPAPVPIPDYKPSFYFRMDAGLGVISKPSLSESGYQYGGLISGGSYVGGHNGGDGYSGSFADGPDLQALDADWFSTDFSKLSTFGAGVGYYLGNGWRMDATVEKRSNDQAYIQGSASWDAHSYYDVDGDGVNETYGTDANLDGDANGDGSVADRRTTINVSDKTDVDGTVWMANAYYDFGSSGRRGFTPYVGAGIGLVWNQLDRTHTTTVEHCDLEAACGAGGGPTTVYTSQAQTSANTVSLAAAAMAGVSYQISDITSIDVGYRYLFLGGTDFAMSIDGTESRVSVGDQHVHQVRAGLRFDVN